MKVTFSFGEALERLKEGRKVVREGWNCAGTSLKIAYATYPYKDGRVNSTVEFKHSFEAAGSAMSNFVVIRTPEGSLIPWVASQEDVLADDWVETEPTAILLTVDRVNKDTDLGNAVKMLQEGKAVARRGWVDTFLVLYQGHSVDKFLQASHPDGEVNGESKYKSGQMLPFILKKPVGESRFWGKGYADYVPWTISQDDLLAEDWGEYGVSKGNSCKK